VKKRAHRERRFQPLEASDVVASARDEIQAQWRGALQEAVDRSLSRREAALIHATLRGVAPKTVSNEKTLVVRKLRDVLVADPAA
jgi:hypothetical protein